ncbi:MAG: lytic transglycosylase domain-containing protein [Deferribacteres bacterium]|nr:lytic transglycosylase domain-containing protein [candidate division KSB1 bacterium]MCB9512372.1 lytic transglycosylase domain-containing protein [Deferribacteres bacterium]
MAPNKRWRKVIGKASIEFLLSSRQDQVINIEGDAFKIGTGAKCEIKFDPIIDADVADFHATLIYQAGKWFIVPQDGAKIWVNEKQVGKYLEVPNGSMLFLGRPMGPGIRVFGQTESTISRRTLAILLSRGAKQGRMVSAAANLVAEEARKDKERFRKTIFKMKKLQTKRSQKLVLALLAVAFLGGAGIIYQYNKLANLRVIAEGIFYQMKSLEIQIAQQQLRGLDASAERSQLAELSKSYDSYLEELDIGRGFRGYEDKLILRMARIFGESELEMPAEFSETVKAYIRKWQSSPRLNESIMRSLQFEYVEPIVKAMFKEGLPPHYYYLALQESDFDTSKVGPRTRIGIAKGMWQFMPATALQYGLKIGPLANVRVTDPRDERHYFEKSTEAAAEYLKRIYSTEAQASGLLVIASYNYGENRVRSLIRSMEENPRERNFWSLMRKFQLPKQTRDYVFYIFSAAVICEDPEYFGFKFSNPLADFLG